MGRPRLRRHDARRPAGDAALSEVLHARRSPSLAARSPRALREAWSRVLAGRRYGRPASRSAKSGCCKQHVDGVDEPEIGYLIHAPYWRQGYALEAAAGVRDYAFGELGKRRVISLIRPVNIPSQRVSLRVGMKPERLTTWHDREHIMFSMTRAAADGAP